MATHLQLINGHLAHNDTHLTLCEAITNCCAERRGVSAIVSGLTGCCSHTNGTYVLSNPGGCFQGAEDRLPAYDWLLGEQCTDPGYCAFISPYYWHQSTSIISLNRSITSGTGFIQVTSALTGGIPSAACSNSCCGGTAAMTWSWLHDCNGDLTYNGVSEDFTSQGLTPCAAPSVSIVWADL